MQQKKHNKNIIKNLLVSI